MADLGTGTTIVFATSAFAAQLLDISGPGATRVSVNTSSMGTTNSHTFVPGDLVDRGEVQITFEFEGADEPPVDAATETITIDWGGAGAGNKWAFSGFMTNFEPQAQMEERMTATATLKATGDVTVS